VVPDCLGGVAAVLAVAADEESGPTLQWQQPFRLYPDARGDWAGRDLFVGQCPICILGRN
jgi:hypothetical protein